MTRKVLALQIADMALDPVTWLSGIACLSVAGFTRSQACGYAVLGTCLLLTPLVPRLLRIFVSRCK